MSGVFFVVCVPTTEQEVKLKQKHQRSRVRAHSDTTVMLSPEDIHAEEVQRCRSNDEFVSPVKGSAGKVDPRPNGTFLKSDIASVKTSWGDIKQAVTSKIYSSRPALESSENDFVKPEEISLEKVVSAVLEHAKVKDAVWCHGKDEEYYQVFFSLEGGAACEEVLHLFGLWGVGKEWNSVVSVIPCALYYHGSAFRESKDCTTGCNGLPQNDKYHNIEEGRDFPGKGGNKRFDGMDKRTAWSKFVSSVRTRLTVAQVAQLIRADAAFTFDWLFLLIVSAFVAAIGLVENSTVFLVASMLISPLMGPIMAGTFGTAIKDRDLQKMGVLHELFGLFLALVIGFFFGIVLCGIDENYGVGEWPTYEMMSRCELRSLWVGALIAVPSGAAVAIAVLGDNTASLVGVAISASLLPPAVNAGLLWAMALIHLIFLDDETRFTTVVKTSVYSSNPAAELAIDGTISLCLTLVNIVCIYFAGILVYKIKEVAPIYARDISFWKTDGSADCNGKNKEMEQSTESTDGTDDKSDAENAENKWNCFRGQSPQFSTCAGNHATWSPASLDFLSRPHLRDIESLYQDTSIQRRQHSEDPVILRLSNERQYPRTRHGLFSPGSAADNIRNILGSKRYKHLTEESSPKASESTSSICTESKSVTNSGSKFTVTPVLSSTDT